MENEFTFTFNLKKIEELNLKLKSNKQYEEFKLMIDTIQNEFLLSTKTINDYKKSEKEISPSVLNLYTDTTNAFLLTAVENSPMEDRVKLSIENMDENKIFLKELYDSIYNSLEELPEMEGEMFQEEVSELFSDTAFFWNNVKEPVELVDIRLGKMASARLKYILFLQNFRDLYEKNLDIIKGRKSNLDLTLKDIVLYLGVFSSYGMLLYRRPLSPVQKLVLAIIFIYSISNLGTESKDIVIIILFCSSIYFLYSMKKENIIAPKYVIIAALLVGLYINNSSVEKYKDRLLYDKTRRENLLEELYSRNMMYKKVTVDENGKKTSSYMNLSDDLILLLEKDEIYVPYIEFILKIYKFRNQNFPSSKNSCYKFFDSFFQNINHLLIDSLSNKDYFEEDVPGIYKTNVSEIYKKKTTPFTKLDLRIIKLIVKNKDNIKASCEDGENYKKINDIMVFHFNT